jgi:hypothetical protein
MIPATVWENILKFFMGEPSAHDCRGALECGKTHEQTRPPAAKTVCPPPRKVS